MCFAFALRVAPATVSLLALPVIVSAQTAEITGRVTDATDAVIPAVAIIITNVENGSIRQTQTNRAGLYTVPTLQPGSYSVAARQEGFKPVTQSGIRLEVGQIARVNFQLEIGSITESVEVVATASELQLETDSNSLGTVVDSERVNELPLNGRNFLQLGLLAAGTGEANGTSKHGQVPHEGRFISIGGNKTSATAYLINGIQQRGTRLGELSLGLSVVNVDEFKIEQSFFMLDQGPNAGIVSVTTKGGGNEIHGQAFHFLRNEALDARNFFSPTPENLKRNQFGAGIGGPIKRNRVWYYASYEGLREVTGFTNGVFTPTQRMFEGDFAELAETIYDPLTFSESFRSRQPFAGQRIPANRINAVAKGLLAYYLPGSSLAQRPNNLFLNPRNTQDSDQFSGRIDASLSGRQQMFFQYIDEDTPTVQGGAFRLSGRSYPTEAKFLNAQHTFTISPSLVQTIRAAFSLNQALISNEGRESGNLAAQLGFRNSLDPRGVPSVSLQGFAGFGNATGDLGNHDNNYQLDYGMNLLTGSHQIKFGVGTRHRRTWQQNANAGAVGTTAFQNIFTAALAPDPNGRPVPQSGSGSSFADFLLGFPTSASVQGLPVIPYRHWQIMPYFQDSWKIRPSFTLNYGIGWFLDTIPDPQGPARDLVHGYNPDTGLLTFAIRNEISTKVLAVDKNNYTPRLGFAWKPNFLPRTVIRAGAGVYYSDISFIDLQNAVDGPPFNARIRGDNDPRVPVPVFRMGLNLFPPSIIAPVDENYAGNLPNGTGLKLLWEGGRVPYVTQWNFSLQHSLSGNDLITLDYQGSSAHSQQTRRQAAQCVPRADLFCDNSTRLWPRYSELQIVDHVGNISYESFSARYNHRYSAGLDLRVEYGYSKGLSDSYEITGFDHQIWTCRACDKGHISFDQTHRAVVSALWEVPFGRGRRFGAGAHPAANAILGGWIATTITSFSTGFPIRLTSPNVTNSVRANHLPNRVCGGSSSELANKVRNNGFVYFDTSCFPRPAAGFFGNSNRNPLHGPGRNNWDIGIQKNFSFGEDFRLQFRTEMFNAFNHAQFDSPNGNAGDSRNFGRISSAALPRLIQFGLKVIW